MKYKYFYIGYGVLFNKLDKKNDIILKDKIYIDKYLLFNKLNKKQQSN
jgi:hypothetical protein